MAGRSTVYAGPLARTSLAWAVLLLVVISPSAGAVGSQAAVRNLAPEILEWEVTVDERLGVFDYHVRAYDGNGVEDLARLAFYVIDEEDGSIRDVQYVEDHRHTNRTTALWQGVLIADGAPYTSPQRVELHVIDINQGRAIAHVPYRSFDIAGATGPLREAGGPIPMQAPQGDLFRGPLQTLTARVEPLAPLGPMALMTLGLALVALLGAGIALHSAHRPQTVRPDDADATAGLPRAVIVHRRAGGRPGRAGAAPPRARG